MLIRNTEVFVKLLPSDTVSVGLLTHFMKLWWLTSRDYVQWTLLQFVSLKFVALQDW